MFKDGVRPTDLSGFVPFKEQAGPVDFSIWNFDIAGESPLYGALLEMKALPGRHVGSAAGRGAATIAELSKGTVPYARVLAQVNAAKTDRYSVSMIWMQGESDFGNTNYAQQLKTLFNDLRADIKAASGADTKFYICLTVHPDVAAAEQQVAQEMPGVAVACDTATLAKSDYVHLTATSSREAGRAIGQRIAADVAAL
jgi:hypothetical protein